MIDLIWVVIAILVLGPLAVTNTVGIMLTSGISRRRRH